MRYRRTISALLLPVTLLQLTGCTHKVWIGPEKLHPEGEYIHGVQTILGEQVLFDKPKTVKRGNTVIAGRVDEELRRYSIEDVEQVRVQRGNTSATVGVFLVFVVAAAAVAALLALESWDGPLGNCCGG